MKGTDKPKLTSIFLITRSPSTTLPIYDNKIFNWYYSIYITSIQEVTN